MTTTVTFRKAGSCGQERRLSKIRFHAMAMHGLWLVLAASGMILSSKAVAQDAPWQKPPGQQSSAVTPGHSDGELPNGAVVPDDVPARRMTPVPPEAIESSSNHKTAKKEAVPTGEMIPPGESRTVPGKASAPPQPVVVDQGKPLGLGELFADPDEDGDECDFGYSCSGFLRGVLSNRVWFRDEALLWWIRGGQTPPLLTTSPTPANPNVQSLAKAGVLGQTGTTVLFGDQELNTGLHAGNRLTFGLCLDGSGESGLEFSYLLLGQKVQLYSRSSSGTTVLARPFYDVSSGTTNGPSSHVIAFPDYGNGVFNANSTENFQGADVLWRQAVVSGSDGHIDFLGGYRFQRLTDGLTIADSVTSSGTLNVAPSGTKIDVVDLFHTRNDFNGINLGFATQWHQNRWSLDTSLKLGIGRTSTQVLINGWTTVVPNGTGTPIPLTGGLLALPSNMGTHYSEQFSMMPEVGFTVGYDLFPRLKATVGYTLLYWGGVARPGDQIDPNVDSRQFPSPSHPNPTGYTQPAFVLHTSDFWAQGLNVGLDYRF